MGYIGHERRAQSTAANMHIPLSMFVQPTPQQGYYRPVSTACVRCGVGWKGVVRRCGVGGLVGGCRCGAVWVGGCGLFGVWRSVSG